MRKDLYIYGRNVILEMIHTKPESLKRVYIRQGGKQSVYDEVKVLARRAGVPLSEASDRQISEWVGDVSHQGVIALAKPFEYNNLSEFLSAIDDDTEFQNVLILDHLTDVANIGAIVRSATAMRVDAIIVAELNQAPVTSAVYKTSAGTVGKIPIIQVGNINQCIELLKQKKFWVVGLSSHDQSGTESQPIWNYQFDDAHSAVIIGNEGEGIRAKTLEHCDTILKVPMAHGVESLNASVTAGIVIYEILRQRSKNK
jgi:23S rRNA (guanosine2251-2'-O)-methyltransferase